MPVLRDKVVTTRKEHKCWGCGEKFEKGSKLRYQVDVEDGKLNDSYWCKVCDATVKESYEEQVDCGIGFGDVRDYESWGKNLQIMERTYKQEERVEGTLTCDLCSKEYREEDSSAVHDKKMYCSDKCEEDYSNARD